MQSGNYLVVFCVQGCVVLVFNSLVSNDVTDYSAPQCDAVNQFSLRLQIPHAVDAAQEIIHCCCRGLYQSIGNPLCKRLYQSMCDIEKQPHTCSMATVSRCAVNRHLTQLSHGAPLTRVV